MATNGQIIAGDTVRDDRYKLSWTTTSSSMSDNTSTLSWVLSYYFYNVTGPDGYDSYTITFDGQTFTGKTEILYATQASGWYDVASGTVALSHNADGTKTFAYSFKITRSSSSVYTANGTGTLDALPRPAVIKTAQNFNNYENPTVTYSSPAGTITGTVAAAISLTGETDDIAYRDVGTSGSYTFNLTDAERAILNNAVTNGTATTVRFYIRNTIDNVHYWSYLTKTYSITDYTPTFSPTVVDTNSRTIALTGSSSKLVRYYSNASVTFGAAAAEGATIVSRNVINGSQNIDIEDSGQDTVTINNIDSNTFYLSATDSRGYIGRDFVVFSEDAGDFIPYVKLTNNLTTGLLSSTGQLTFTVKGKYFDGSFGATNNTLEVEYLVLDANGDPVFNTEGSGWVQLGTVTPSMDGNNYNYSYTISGLDYNGTYELTVNVIDELTPVQTVTKVIAATPIFDWGKDDFRFNVPVYLKDSNVPLEAPVDTVVEQGIYGEWYYRKWASGQVELSATQDISDLACDVALGGWYRTQVQSSPSFPFSIYSPRVTVSYESAGYGALVWPTTVTSSSKPFDYYLIRPTSSTGITGTVIYHVVGEW